MSSSKQLPPNNSRKVQGNTRQSKATSDIKVGKRTDGNEILEAASSTPFATTEPTFSAEPSSSETYMSDSDTNTDEKPRIELGIQNKQLFVHYLGDDDLRWFCDTLGNTHPMCNANKMSRHDVLLHWIANHEEVKAGLLLHLFFDHFEHMMWTE